MLVEVSIAPVGEGTSVSRFVARAVEIIRESGLKHEFHAMGTNIEGSYEEISAVVKKCIDAQAEMGANRIIVRMYMDDRRDKPSTLQRKRGSVEAKLK